MFLNVSRFSNGSARSKANCLFAIEIFFMSACRSNCCCMGLFADVAIICCKQPEKCNWFEWFFAIIPAGKIKGLDKISGLH